MRLTKGDTITDAWFKSAKNTYKYAKAGQIPGNVYFRVAGWDTCFNDRLSSYTDPDPDLDLIAYQEQLVASMTK